MRKRHRSNFFTSLLALVVPLLFHGTGNAHVPAHQVLTGDYGIGDDRSAEAEPEENDRIRIKTTAYTHTEADHLKYGARSAAGTPLRSGAVTSAAADWSKFPIGTKFKIAGRDGVYVIDDYGSALVGKDVIDLYKTSRGKMNEWGARTVHIEVVEWGDFDKSLEILKPRAKYARHVREMIEGLENRESIDPGRS